MPKAFSRSFEFENSPFPTFAKTLSDWRTSRRSFSTPSRFQSDNYGFYAIKLVIDNLKNFKLLKIFLHGMAMIQFPKKWLYSDSKQFQIFFHDFEVLPRQYSYAASDWLASFFLHPYCCYPMYFRFSRSFSLPNYDDSPKKLSLWHSSEKLLRPSEKNTLSKIISRERGKIEI